MLRKASPLYQCQKSNKVRAENLKQVVWLQNSAYKSSATWACGSFIHSQAWPPSPLTLAECLHVRHYAFIHNPCLTVEQPRAACDVYFL